MMEKAKACELFDTSGKNVNHFKVSSYGGHDLEGWICKSRGHKMGSLIIETVDGKETLQYVQGMPKIKYYDSRDEFTTPHIFEKYDGTNIVAFPLIVDGIVEEVMFKTRGLPQADKGFYDKTMEVWPEDYSIAVSDEKLSFAFELYGSNNSHEVNYREHGVELDLVLLSILDKGKGLPVQNMFDIANYNDINVAFPHFTVTYFDNEYCAIPTMAFENWYGQYIKIGTTGELFCDNLYELYKSLESIYERINMSYQKDHPGIIIEGSVWHYGETENHLIKNKALSVREGHIKQACGIPHHDIRKAIIKTDESYDGELREASVEYIINNVNDELLEEYENSMVYDKKTEDKIKAVLGKYLRKVEVTEELETIVSQLQDECGVDADPSDMMRHYSTLPIYSKSLVGKVYQAIVSMS